MYRLSCLLDGLHQRGRIQRLVAAQLRDVGMQQMGVIHTVQKVSALPSALLQSEGQLLADTAGHDGILGKEDGFVTLQSLTQALRQRIDLHQLAAIDLDALLCQQIGSCDDLFAFGTVADQDDFGFGIRMDEIIRVAGALQRC